MSTAGTPLPKELTSHETNSLLQRILAVVEKEKRNGWQVSKSTLSLKTLIPPVSAVAFKVLL